MDQHVEICVIVTQHDGTRTATVLHNRPNWIMRGPGFIYRYLRESRKKDAPSFFRYGVIENDQAEAVAALADHTAKDYEAAMERLKQSLTPGN